MCTHVCIYIYILGEEGEADDDVPMVYYPDAPGERDEGPRPLTKKEKAAKETGLDSDLLKKQMGEKALQAFKTDLELTRTMGVRGFPTLLFSDASGKHLALYGSKPYAQFEQTMKALLPEVEKKEFETSAEALFARFPTLTSQEFAILSGKSKLQAEKELNHLFEEKKLQKTSTKNGSLWIWKTH